MSVTSSEVFSRLEAMRASGALSKEIRLRSPVTYGSTNTKEIFERVDQHGNRSLGFLKDGNFILICV